MSSKALAELQWQREPGREGELLRPHPYPQLIFYNIIAYHPSQIFSTIKAGKACSPMRTPFCLQCHCTSRLVHKGRILLRPVTLPFARPCISATSRRVRNDARARSLKPFSSCGRCCANQRPLDTGYFVKTARGLSPAYDLYEESTRASPHRAPSTLTVDDPRVQDTKYVSTLHDVGKTHHSY
jgi:hypothetical protein